MLLDKFKKIVDESPGILILNSDLEQAYNLLGLERKNGLASKVVTDKLYENISNAILREKKTKDGLKKHEFIKLRSELIYRHVLYNEDPVEYLKIISVINDSCRNDGYYFTSFDDLNSWREAISFSKSFNNYLPTTFEIKLDQLRKEYPKEFDKALSAKMLSQKGCKIEIKDSEITIVSGLEKLAENLDSKIKELGGLTIIKSLFNHLSSHNQFSKEFERYFMPRRISGLGFEQTPQIPIGYLLNLALKYPTENAKIRKPQNKLNEIMNLATIITNGAYGVQQYSMWENLFQAGETIIRHCVDTALWDSIFNFQQSRPTTTIEVANKLFSFIEDNYFETSIGFSRSDLFEVIIFINRICKENNQITTVYSSCVQQKLKNISKERIQKILDFLSHTEQVNENYKIPSDYTEINFFLKPLIKVSSTKFILVNKSFCCPNYFEALATHFREDFKKNKKNLDEILGTQLEVFLQEKLKEKGVGFHSGTYKVDGIDGECDLLIESDNSIILIEFKKKPLTRKAKSGIDINILLDLVESVLNAQVQAGRTEIILKEKGRICLKDEGGNENIISLNGRVIERIALTQLEFGGFQDRVFISQFLKSLLTHSFNTNSDDAMIIKKFVGLNEKQIMLREQHSKLLKLNNDAYKKNPFFNCWFLGLPQLMEIISLSTNNNTFYEALLTTKYITMGTNDWYYEFNYANYLKNIRNVSLDTIK